MEWIDPAFDELLLARGNNHNGGRNLPLPWLDGGDPTAFATGTVNPARGDAIAALTDFHPAIDRALNSGVKTLCFPDFELVSKDSLTIPGDDFVFTQAGANGRVWFPSHGKPGFFGIGRKNLRLELRAFGPGVWSPGWNAPFLDRRGKPVFQDLGHGANPEWNSGGHLERGIHLIDSADIWLDAEMRNFGMAQFCFDGCTGLRGQLYFEGTHRYDSPITMGDPGNRQVGLYFMHTQASGPCDDFDLRVEGGWVGQGVLSEYQAGAMPTRANSLQVNLHDIVGQHGLYWTSSNCRIRGTIQRTGLSAAKVAAGDETSVVNVDVDIQAIDITGNLFETYCLGSGNVENVSLRSQASKIGVGFNVANVAASGRIRNMRVDLQVKHADRVEQVFRKTTERPIVGVVRGRTTTVRCPDHKRANGDQVVLALKGVPQLGREPVSVTVVSADEFSVPVDSRQFPPVITGTMIVAAMASDDVIQIQGEQVESVDIALRLDTSSKSAVRIYGSGRGVFFSRLFAREVGEDGIRVTNKAAKFVVGECDLEAARYGYFAEWSGPGQANVRFSSRPRLKGGMHDIRDESGSIREGVGFDLSTMSVFGRTLASSVLLNSDSGPPASYQTLECRWIVRDGWCDVRTKFRIDDAAGAAGVLYATLPIPAIASAFGLSGARSLGTIRLAADISSTDLNKVRIAPEGSMGYVIARDVYEIAGRYQVA